MPRSYGCRVKYLVCDTRLIRRSKPARKEGELARGPEATPDWTFPASWSDRNHRDGKELRHSNAMGANIERLPASCSTYAFQCGRQVFRCDAPIMVSV